MASVPELHLRRELLARRARLDAARAAGAALSIAELIAEVDAALARVDAGTYGLCETCHDPIEADRLVADPLTTFCLDHLSAQERLQLERDMVLAREIQHALLPPRDAVLAGWDLHYVYRPLGTVSGDYCDVIEPLSDMPTVVVGDVSGKGVSASILMSNLHALFRSLSGAGVPFEQIMSRVNHIFCGSTLPSSFATIAFARLAPSGAMELCNAGHCPPIVVRGHDVESLAPTGIAVGLFSEAKFTTVRRPLERGDLLVMYTDGITEAFDAQGAEYGAERLAAVVARHRCAAPHEIALACSRDVDDFARHVPLRDDLSIMVVRRTGPA